MSGRYSLLSGTVVEKCGEDFLILLPDSKEVRSVTGASAEIVRKLSDYGSHVLPASEALDGLVEAGIVSVEGVSRRGVFRLGAVGLAAGATTLLLPTAAAATSGCPVISAVPDNGYGGAAVWFRFRANSGTIDNRTQFRWEAAFLPVGTYYYTFTVPSSGGVEGFVLEDSFEVSQDGEFFLVNFFVAGLWDGYEPSDPNAGLETFNDQITFALFSDAARNCPIPFTPDIDEADGGG